MQIAPINLNKDIYNKKLAAVKPTAFVSPISFKGKRFSNIESLSDEIKTRILDMGYDGKWVFTPSESIKADKNYMYINLPNGFESFICKKDDGQILLEKIKNIGLARNWKDLLTKRLKTVAESKELMTKGKHNTHQILSICPEHNNVGLSSCAKGGLGVVTKEAPLSWMKQKIDGKNVDVRTIFPYHFSTERKRGGMALVRIPDDKIETYILNRGTGNDLIQPEWIHEVSADYKPTRNEFFAMVNNNQDSKQVEKIVKFFENGKEVEKKVFESENRGYKYVRLEPTDVRGRVRSLKEGFLQEETVPYRLFKSLGTKGEPKYFMWTPYVSALGEAYGPKQNSYYGGQVIGGGWPDFYYANFNRAVVDSLPQLAEKEGFNPASVWMHDRPMFSAQFEIVNRILKGEKFYNGYKLMSTMHNPGKDYQGWLNDVVGAFKILFNDVDYDKLKNTPDFEIIKNIVSKEGKRTKEDEQIIKAMFGKYFSGLLDEAGRPNLTMVPVLNAKLNKELAKVGTVSLHYDYEMKNITGIAEGLTSKLSEIETHSVTNGSLPASLGIDKQDKFGRGGNGLSSPQNIKNYTPYTPITDRQGRVLNYDKSLKGQNHQTYVKYSIRTKRLAKFRDEKLIPFIVNKLNEDLNKLKEEEKAVKDTVKKEKIAAKIKALESKINKTKELVKNGKIRKVDKNLKVRNFKYAEKLLNKINAFLSSGLIYEKSVKDAKEANKKWVLDLIADQKGDTESLRRLFYNGAQLQDGFSVIGNLSKYQPTDIVITNWGRPDPQKGFSAFLEGYIKFLEDSSVNDTDKKRIKIMFGSGGFWPDNSREYKLVTDAMEKIKQLGYKDNCLYVNGFFPNKLVACSDFGMFTSRFEPCGITPFESYSAGVPVASVRTGGAGNFVKDASDGAENPTGILTKRPFMLSEEELAKEGKFDKVAVKKKILGKKTEWTQEMQNAYEFKLDDARRDVITDEINGMFKRCIEIKDDKNGLYDKMCKNACEQHIEWAKNVAYNNGRSADDVYLNTIFEVGKERKQGEIHKLTGELGDGSNIKLTKIADSVETNVTVARKSSANKLSQGAGFLKRLIADRRTMLVVASLAAVAGITSYALTKDSSKKDNRTASKIGNSKIYF